MLTRTIVLPTPTRYFEKRGMNLSRTDLELPANMKIEVGRIEMLGYDHGALEAVPFSFQGKIYYLLLREIRIVGIVDRLRRFSCLHLVHSVD